MFERSDISKKKISKAFIAGLVIVSAFYLTALFADFLAPYGYSDQSRMEPSAPPSIIRLCDENGDWHRPFIYANRLTDARNLRYEEIRDTPQPIELFTRGSSYNFLGVIKSDLHLFGIQDAKANVRLLGTDQLGRDRFSRLLYAIRFSLIVSPLGTILACLIGIFIGVVSGYVGRRADAVLMGTADAMLSLPTLILILAARAAFPLELPPLTASLLLITIFGLTGWAEMARLTRTLVWSMREREFVLAAKASGLTQTGILCKHIFPNIAGPIFIQATLMFPAFLLAEIALSFLGVGLQEPEPSLGNMLAVTGDLTRLQNAPFVILSPAIVIFIFVFGVRLIGLRNKNKVS